MIAPAMQMRIISGVERKEHMDWMKIELLDRLSVHDEHWLIENEEGTKQATGVYSCGELVDILDISDIPNV